MMINPIDPLNKVNKIGKVGNNAKAASPESLAKKGGESGDSIKISPEAKGLLESQKVLEIAQKEPDIRTAKVNQIKKIIQDGSFEQIYFTNEVLDEVADKITDTFLGKG